MFLSVVYYNSLLSFFYNYKRVGLKRFAKNNYRRALKLPVLRIKSTVFFHVTFVVLIGCKSIKNYIILIYSEK